MRSHLRRLKLLIALGVGGATAAAQDGVASGDSLGGVLRVEATTARRLYSPNRPVWVRLTVQNTSDEAVEVPVSSAPESDGGIALPPEIVFGTPGEPALFVAYQEEKPVAIQPPAAVDPAQAHQGVLRLAPHACVGAEVDLREHFSALRYSGNYRVEWRPLGGRAGGGAADFRVETRKDAIIVTDKGKITCTLAYDDAPRNVENFLDLVREGFYDGKTIHRIIPGFLIQGGCPKGDGKGVRPDGKLVPAELNNTPFDVGTVAMAHKPSDPNSASCQFFITLARLPELDGRYTVIGQARDEESARTLNQIAAEPTDQRNHPRLPLVIRSITLVDVEQSGTTRFDTKPTRSTAPAPTPRPPEAKADGP